MAYDSFTFKPKQKEIYFMSIYTQVIFLTKKLKLNINIFNTK